MYRGTYFDHDPLTGLVEYYEETPDGKGHIHTYQDVQPHLDAAQRLRNEGAPDDVWKRDGVTMYASLPLSIVGQMMKRGINIFDQNDMPKVIAEVNSTYANFKTTYKHHALKNK
jgi:hypothetical protein